MTESKRLAKAHRLKALIDDSKKVSLVLFACGLVFLIPLVVIMFINDLEHTTGWLILFALFAVVCFFPGVIMWRFGVKDSKEKLLNREL